MQPMPAEFPDALSPTAIPTVVLTGYDPTNLGPGSTTVVIGTGGLGQMAIQILRALSAATTIIAVDSAVDKLETARRMGADDALLAGDAAVARVKDLTRGQGAKLVLDFVGVNPTEMRL